MNISEVILEKKKREACLHAGRARAPMSWRSTSSRNTAIEDCLLLVDIFKIRAQKKYAEALNEGFKVSVLAYIVASDQLLPRSQTIMDD